MAVKADVKETVEFEDNTLNHNNGYNGLMDKTFSFAGEFSSWKDPKENDIKLLDFKFINVDEDIEFASLQCLLSKV